MNVNEESALKNLLIKKILLESFKSNQVMNKIYNFKAQISFLNLLDLINKVIHIIFKHSNII